MEAVAPTHEDAMALIREETQPYSDIVHLCGGGVVPFYSQNPDRWTCGFRCIMMMALALAVRNGGEWAVALMDAGLVVFTDDGLHASGVQAIKRAIVKAWAAGWNLDGQAEIEGRSPRPFIDRTGSRAGVGSCQAWAVFRDAGLPVTTRAFYQADRVDDLLQRARAYFLVPDRAPWILTFSNHVRLVVGFIDDRDNPQLIVVDPSWSDVRGVEVLTRATLRAQKYEVMSFQVDV